MKQGLDSSLCPGGCSMFMDRSCSGGYRARSIRVGLIAIWLLAAFVPAAEASGTASNASITVLHGLPQFTADVYVNGKLLLDGFKPESVTQPISVPAGTYHIAI